MNEELLSSVALEHLDGNARELADTIGLEAFIKLVLRYGGTDNLYIPVVKSVVQDARDALIREEFNGGNFLELSRKWGMTERYIRELVKDKTKQIRLAPIEGQISLFETCELFQPD